jgi:NAD(P)-dependent dehydrogenase (short-subunit alcohol dehydrogenase family)
MARFGARIVLADIEGTIAQSEAEALRTSGFEAIGVEVDHTDPDAVDRLVQAAEDEFGSIDVLVNNAGVLSLYDVFEMEMGHWDRVMEVNLRGPLLCMKRVLPRMAERRSGNIINLGSGWSSRGAVFNQSGGGPDYCASKAALQCLTRSVACHTAPYGIRVNSISPGVVDTPMHTPHREMLFTRLPWIPLGRLQTAADVVGAAVYLASDASSYVTGQVIHVNGGLLMND